MGFWRQSGIIAGPPIIDILDHLVYRHLGDGALQMDKGSHHQNDRVPMSCLSIAGLFGHCFRSASKPPCNNGVKCFDSSVADSGNPGNLGYVLNRQTCVAQRLAVRPVLSNSTHARERCPVRQTVLVRYGKEARGNGGRDKASGRFLWFNLVIYGSSSDKSSHANRQFPGFGQDT